MQDKIIKQILEHHGVCKFCNYNCACVHKELPKAIKIHDLIKILDNIEYKVVFTNKQEVGL